MVAGWLKHLSRTTKVSQYAVMPDYVAIPRQLLEALADNTDELIIILNSKRMRTKAYMVELKQARAILDT